MHANISIIVPILNEADTLPELFEHLLYFQRQGCEVILIDGGSADTSLELGKRSGFTIYGSPRGRALQMNTGASYANGGILLFLHADTRLPVNADRTIIQALTASHKVWGRFDVNIKGKSSLLRLVAFMMNLRSRLTGIATGDQAIFVRRNQFVKVGGFPDQPLMEDIELSTRLKKVSAPICLRDKVTTSGRRWEKHGVIRTVLLMLRLRLAYYLGISVEQLARSYW